MVKGSTWRLVALMRFNPPLVKKNVGNESDTNAVPVDFGE